MSPAQLAQYWRTTRHLQLSQIAWRARRIAGRMAEQRLPAWPLQQRGEQHVQARLGFQPPPLTRAVPYNPLQLLSELSEGNLTLLNEQKQLGLETIDWHSQRGRNDQLWKITLHYHQWLYALAVHAHGSPTESGRQAASLLQRYLWDWLQQCGSLTARTNRVPWDAYAIATRLEWWARIIALLDASPHSDDHRLATALRSSAAEQTRHLQRHLEWDLRANHLLRDCVGLAAASWLFTGREAERWYRTARRIALKQAREQVLFDGGHFERSPMYHLETLEDFALLAYAFAEDPTAHQQLVDTVQRMTTFAAWMQYSDGHTPQLNDCTRRCVAPTLATVSELVGTALPPPPSGFQWFEQTGIVAYHNAEWSIFLDCGAVGPDYQPGHTHADTLTLEAAIGGERLLIDPGASCYDSGPQRSAERATASHNTVCVDQLDSSEVWHIFRVGRRAYPAEVVAEETPAGFFASAAHTGYDHLPGQPRHIRRVELLSGNTLLVSDELSGRGTHHVQGQWLLEPGWQAQQCSDGWLLQSQQQAVRVILSCNAPLTLNIEPAECHFEFGHTASTLRLRWSYEGLIPLAVRTLFRRS